MFKGILLAVAITLFAVGFHSVDLAVNVLILSPDTFWNGSDCGLIYCRDYATIYRYGLSEMALGFIILSAASGCRDKAAQQFHKQPKRSECQRSKNDNP